jgi:hypothetical protein
MVELTKRAFGLEPNLAILLNNEQAPETLVALAKVSADYHVVFTATDDDGASCSFTIRPHWNFAFVLLNKAQQLGSVNAYMVEGDLSKSVNDYTNMLRCYKRAAELGNTAALVALGDYENKTSSGSVAAVVWYTLAYRAGNQQALSRLNELNAFIAARERDFEPLPQRLNLQDRYIYLEVYVSLLQIYQYMSERQSKYEADNIQQIERRHDFRDMLVTLQNSNSTYASLREHLDLTRAKFAAKPHLLGLLRGSQYYYDLREDLVGACAKSLCPDEALRWAMRAYGRALSQDKIQHYQPALCLAQLIQAAQPLHRIPDLLAEHDHDRL